MNKKDLLKHEDLLKRLHYDPETGLFTKCQSGLPAGNKPVPDQRRMIKVFGHGYYQHRLAWFYMTGKWPVNEIDHIDRNPSNNKFSNLREADRFQNNQNRDVRKDSKTGIRGVMKNKNGTFFAKISCRYKLFRGTFYSLEEAVKWRNSMELELFEYSPLKNAK